MLAIRKRRVVVGDHRDLRPPIAESVSADVATCDASSVMHREGIKTT